jgi:hypothetical protein
MLQAGGLPLLTDGVRGPDGSNVGGYFELEAVKGLDKPGDQAWLRDARGQAVKVISWLLTWLPETYDYRVIYMYRDLDEVVASQNAMLLSRGEPGRIEDPATMRQIYADHIEQVQRFLARRPCFTTLTLQHRDVLDRPDAESRRVAEFLQRPLDVGRMAAAVDPRQYRSRAAKPGPAAE